MRFDERASAYERHARPQAEVARRLAAHIPTVDTPVDALELGAGTGLLTRELVRLGYRVRATDASPAMLRAGEKVVPGAHWEILDAWNPPPACCDQIFSSSLLQWCPDAIGTFKKYREALRPGGTMTHAVFTSGTLRELHSIPGIPDALEWRNEDDWKDAALAAGFKKITFGENLDFRARYADAASLLRELHGTGAVSEKPRLSSGDLRRSLREYDRRFGSSEGGVEATWCAFLFSAKA